MDKKQYYIAYQLQFFADGPGGEKTEDATTKKLDDARKKGQVAKSVELNNGVQLLILFLAIKLLIGFLGERFVGGFSEYFDYINRYSGEVMNTGIGQSIVNDAIQYTIITMLPILIITLVTSFVIMVAQVKWKLSGEPLKPKFDKISPISGFKRMFSKDKIMELVKSIVKIIVIIVVAYNELKSSWGVVRNLYSVSLESAILLIGDTVINLGIKISVLFLIIGLADLFYQKRKFKNYMKMTKQEIKDEFKQTEGDPQIKSKIRAKMREASQRRMMQQLPEADVVITNPTHLAVAIKYEKGSSSAPVVIAKGADYIAQKIKDAAREHQIEIVENKPLARMLYYNVELGDEIPSELYQMVAEVLAYVYTQKKN